MRILILETHYDEPLNLVYRNHPGLERVSYDEQLRAIYDLGFARADFLPLNLTKLGHETAQFIVNAPALQKRWAKEHQLRLPAETSDDYLSALRQLARRGRASIRWRVGRRSAALREEWELRVVAAQVEGFNPDVILNCDVLYFPADFLRSLKTQRRLLIGEVSYPIPASVDLRPYDLFVSAAPHYVERLRRAGARAEFFRLGFEASILDRLDPAPAREGVVFIGALGKHHRGRIHLLEEVSRCTPLDCWGQGGETLSLDSPIRKRLHPPLWGYDMYKQLQRARITLNSHIDVAENQAGNMRLYEATGVGTLLITDDKENLGSLFEPGQEVITYRSPQECVERIAYYLTHEQEREAIARAGQARTLREHTYYHRMQELVELLTPMVR